MFHAFRRMEHHIIAWLPVTWQLAPRPPSPTPRARPGRAEICAGHLANFWCARRELIPKTCTLHKHSFPIPSSIRCRCMSPGRASMNTPKSHNSHRPTRTDPSHMLRDHRDWSTGLSTCRCSCHSRIHKPRSIASRSSSSGTRLDRGSNCTRPSHSSRRSMRTDPAN